MLFPFGINGSECNTFPNQNDAKSNLKWQLRRDISDYVSASVHVFYEI